MSGKRILVIEDDLRLSRTLRNVLLTNDFEAEIANSGAEGIQKAYEYAPDLILCDIKMSPIDGYQVYNILRDSSITNRIPFIFITGKSDLEDIRFGLDLGVDDYIVKPFNNEDLLKSIQVRLDKYEKLVNIGKNDYKALVELSPSGIFLFDGETIYEANKAFSLMTGIDQNEITKISFKDFVDEDSFNKVQGKIQKCTNGLLKSFGEDVNIKGVEGKHSLHKLYVTTSQMHKGLTLLIGLLAPEDQYKKTDRVEYEKLINILAEEKIDISGNLASKLKKVFNITPSKKSANEKSISVDIFSKREQEVLQLSCQGLPIKIIADQLCISDRTVEKHRASLMEKTGSKNIVEVIIYALKNELIEI
ncbi:response regulator [Sunxiuqinia sp. A32]|uniref:response regulator n=1 Tax=Sunxiuqinia sp. A32 TaxID=3461496 RepID=UPI00404672F9